MLLLHPNFLPLSAKDRLAAVTTSGSISGLSFFSSSSSVSTCTDGGRSIALLSDCPTTSFGSLPDGSLNNTECSLTLGTQVSRCITRLQYSICKLTSTRN